ncbi:L,D-transpeptidase [Roseovarius indicus]|uniref:Putative L,D-transpeptidase ErfK/SrfK n=1 Tax=Roseovarius indicus TaxID=540747 RepID=A0A5P3ALF6_9RHOB|nr:L,D-transpeptidase [Roseovarius indicus]QEW29583.1 putative L,D-transpeptidase ErfK/SrfK precursor [Roseovarius indicus]SFE47152.1 Lipoprotein-anchoring transpeptidase ErfK/SrfK [Roseovarius indicus]
MKSSLPNLAASAGLVLLTSCAATTPDPEPVPAPPDPVYGPVEDAGRTIPAVPEAALSARNRRQEVDYWTDEAPGTIVVDPYARFLYLVLEDHRALRYGVAVGEQGRGFSGEAVIPFKREWPRWTPTPNMLRRDPELYEPVRNGMEGGLDNPLGARALYLFKGGRDTLYRIHGTTNPFSIGKAVSLREIYSVSFRKSKYRKASLGEHSNAVLHATFEWPSLPPQTWTPS